MLVASTRSSEAQPVALLGVDASDRAVYRDGPSIMRISLAGGTATALATSPDLARVAPGSASPDGEAILARDYGAARWYVLANDRVTVWDESLGTIVEHGHYGVVVDSRTPIWIGPHTFLARDASGSLHAVDARTSTPVRQGAQLRVSDIVLAHQGGTLLVARGGLVLRVELATGAVRETGPDLLPDTHGVSAAGLPSGGFLLTSSGATYRID